MMRSEDTIVAITSPSGRSARGIVRLSGLHACEIIGRELFESATAEGQATEMPSWPSSCAEETPPRGVYQGCLWSSLPCLIGWFPGPASYTGEDCVELQLPGSPALMQRVVDACITRGARQAEAGEFTARAFFNGRLTLTEAEGVAATISAASDAQLRAAQLLTEGTLGTVAHHLADRVAQALALVEAGIDFVDQEDVVPIPPEQLAAVIDNALAELDATLARATGSEQLSALPRVVLTGPPNAGKSTLFNALLGRKRAVVSDISGTTRDVLAEPMHLQPDDPHSPEIMLIDLAGFDTAQEDLNLQMQRQAVEAIETADLIIELLPHQNVGDEEAVGALMSVTSAGSGAGSILRIRSKADGSAADHSSLATTNAEPCEIAVSAVTGENLDTLRQVVHERLRDRTSSLAADALALQPRHERALQSARDHLGTARAILSQQPDAHFVPDIELVAADLRLGLDAIGDLAGDITPDEVLGRVFASFCVGK